MILYQTIARLPQLENEHLADSSQQFYRELNRFGLTSAIDAGGGGEFLTWAVGDYENFMSARPQQGPTMEAQLEPVLRDLLVRRWPFRIHATYDESVERILDTLEKLNLETPPDGLRWAIDHAEAITLRNIRRIGDLGGGIAVQSRMAFAGEYFLDRYGAETTGNAPPLRKILEAGVPPGAGSDATRVSSYNPWLALHWLVSGRSAGGTPLLNERNRLSREEALRTYTLGSAWLSSEEHLKGRIAPGQFAAMALLSADYFSVPEEEIAAIESVLTIVGGRVVYAAGPFESLRPPLPAPLPAWSPVSRFGGAWRGQSKVPE